MFDRRRSIGLYLKLTCILVYHTEVSDVTCFPIPSHILHCLTVANSHQRRILTSLGSCRRVERSVRDERASAGALATLVRLLWGVVQLDLSWVKGGAKVYGPQGVIGASSLTDERRCRCRLFIALIFAFALVLRLILAGGLFLFFGVILVPQTMALEVGKRQRFVSHSFSWGPSGRRFHSLGWKYNSVTLFLPKTTNSSNRRRPHTYIHTSHTTNQERFLLCRICFEFSVVCELIVNQSLRKEHIRKWMKCVKNVLHYDACVKRKYSVFAGTFRMDLWKNRASNWTRS